MRNRNLKSLFFKVHIAKGCLSGIHPGHSTSINERMHRKLNRSCVVGVSLIGPQLLDEILAVLFYCHNQSLDGRRHSCNSEIVPIIHPPLPLPGTHNVGPTNMVSNEDLIKVKQSQRLENDDRGSNLMQKLVDYINGYRKVVARLQAECRNRSISIYGLVYQEREESRLDDEHIG